MSDSYLTPPKQDIDSALQIEASVKESERAIYLEWMNGSPMSDRTTPRELRDGCILSHAFNRHRLTLSLP